MQYTLDNGKVIEIPNKTIDYFMNVGKCTKEEAIDMWLTDNDYIVNQEQEELNKKAKNAGFRAESGIKTSKKAHKVKVSAEKIELFSEILSDLEDVYKGNVTILTENRQISCKIGKKSFKITITEDRK